MQPDFKGEIYKLKRSYLVFVTNTGETVVPAKQ